MATPDGLSKRALYSPVKFNGEFLWLLVICSLLAILFLFYFNRIFAKVISILARLYLRSIGNSHYVDVESIQISPLAGRIFFGKTVYHGPNETITIVGGHVTWRYWLRRIRHVLTPRDQAGGDDSEVNEKDKSGKLPCRILVELKGVEWFVYNRSPAYDLIAKTINEQTTGGAQENEPPSTPRGKTGIYMNGNEDGKQLQTPKTGSTTLAPGSSHQRATEDAPMASFEDQVANSWMLQMLPIKLECTKGAVVMGNENTPSILVAEFEKANGAIDATKSRSIDLYKQIYDLAFTHPVVHLKPNPDFREQILSKGTRLQNTSQPDLPNGNNVPRPRNRRQKILDLLPIFSGSIKPDVLSEGQARAQDNLSSQRQWMGLSRYIDDSEQQNAWNFEPGEYAQETTILDCQKANISYWYDIVGNVPPHTSDITEGPNYINNSTHPPPEYGVEIKFIDANLNYGPWADRQRIQLQNMFFPKSYIPPKPTEPVAPGQPRLLTELKLFVELAGSTTVKIPIRESSKDWKYKQRQEEGELRPHGWIDIKVGRESTVSYTTDMYASRKGWNSSVSLELHNPEVSSSVNHKLLWKAKNQSLECDLSSPLIWNADTKWTFNNISTGMQVFLLREHVTLLTDLVSDWTSGPAAEYWTFVPMIYELNLVLKDSEFFFNVNDQNIINNANSFEDNTFLILRNLGGERGHLSGSLNMDFREFRPQSSAVNFLVETISLVDGKGALDLGVRTPSWNTWNCSLKNQASLGKVGQVKLKGSYEFYSNITPKLIDTLTLDLDGEELELTLHGFLIRYFLTIKENYFGENVHFKTLEEWQHPPAPANNGGDITETAKSNDIDIVLGVKAKGISILLPKNIYEAQEHIRFGIPSLGLDMRFTNYYMDLQVDLSPISAYLGGSSFKTPEVFVNGVTLYGHRLFGLPPTEPTYVCNWDIDVGSITGECSLRFLQTCLFALKAFVFSFGDVENALPVSTIAVIHDVTFLRLNINGVRLWLRMAEDAVLRLATNDIAFVLNDLADETHSERITLKIPGLTLICINPLAQGSQATTAYLDTEVNVTLFGRKKDALISRRLQQEHIRESDYRTGRARFLLAEDGNESRNINSASGGPVPASMSLPVLPPQSVDFGYVGHDIASSISSGQKSSRSFLQSSRMASSSQTESVLHATSSHDGSSFHSAVESFSDLALATPNTHLLSTSGSPSVTTPDSKSSNYASRFNTRGKRNANFEMTPQPLDVEFSSAFIQPNFPLNELELDLSSVPALDSDTLEDDSSTSSKASRFAVFANDESVRDSFIIEFSPGIRGYCTPSAIKGVATLLEHTQPMNPDEVLDMIQIEVVSKLKRLVKKVSPHSTVIEACLRIPLFKFCFINESVGEHLSGRHAGLQLRSKDSVCVQFRNLAVYGRDKKMVQVVGGGGSKQEEICKMWSLHVTVDSLDFALKDAMKSSTPFSTPAKPAFGVLVQNLLFWASSSDLSTASLQIGSFATSIQGKQALFLYDACMRLAAILQQIGDQFEKIAHVQQNRIRGLVSDLASAGEQFRITQDPASLTRPSYVLRSASDHVRLNDSWKISLRLRHIWQSLSDEERIQRNEKYTGYVNEPLRDARNSFIGVIERWRPWELGSIKDSIIIKHIFGDSGRSSVPKPIKSLSFCAKIAIDTITVLIDPGPSQHEFAIDKFHSCVMMGNQAINQTSRQEAAVAMPGAESNIVVQVHTRNIRLGLRWEGLEIAEKVAKDLWERKQQGGQVVLPEGNVTRQKLKNESKRFCGIHIVMTTDYSSLSLDTVNLKILSMTGGLKISIVISEKSSEHRKSSNGRIGSLLMQADYNTTKICYGDKILSKAMIRTPSLYGYFDEHSFADTEFNIWKVAGSSEDLSFEIREQLLGLVEVVDFVVNDEVAQIYRYMEDMKRYQPQDTTSISAPQSERTIHMVYGTFSLGRFTLSATLLPSLSYVVRGEGVRLSANPNPNDSKEMVIDFDLKHHEHEVRTSTKTSESRSISLLQLPTITTATKFKNMDHEKFLEIGISIQTISLDASSIQSLLNALNKPEVVKVVESSRIEWLGIDARLNEILASSKRKPMQEKAPDPPLKYQASIGVAGLKIQTSAPSANLEINLGFIKARASNRSKNKLSYPDMRLEFGKITLELTQKSAGNSKELCGYLELHTSLEASSKQSDQGTIRIFNVQSHSLKIDLYADTASTVVDVIGHLQDKLRDLDLSREVKYLRKLRTSKSTLKPSSDKQISTSTFSNTQMSISMNGIQISWIVGNKIPKALSNNLVLSFGKISFTTMTRKDSEAQLVIEEFLLQMVKSEARQTVTRSENSALLPRVIFGVTYSTKETEIQLTFQAKGEPLDLRLTSSCVAAASDIESSISTATQKFRDASANWKSTLTESGVERKSMFGSKRLGALSVDADFAGAVVYLSGQSTESKSMSGFTRTQRGSRYGQSTQGETSANTVLQSPGLAFKVRYLDSVENDNDPCLNAEINISASTNTLAPTVVPLILEMSKNVQEVMKQQGTKQPTHKEESLEEGSSEAGSSISSNPAAILGKCRLNIGFRIRPQEFTLSCQPYARVAATAKFEGIYITVNTCEDDKDANRFYAVSATINGLRASLQHVYSRESTGHLEVKMVVLSLMNNKHFMGSQGISCILKLSPIRSQINVKQFQDFLLFREIWVPPEIREKAPVSTVSSEGPSSMLVQKYHEVAATKAFPSNTTIVIEELQLLLDLSQSLGKTTLLVSNLWATSRKTSDWEQTMCLGFDSIRIDSIGRLGGFIDLENMKVRTSISWDSAMDTSQVQVPLIEAAIGFKQLQAKISYEYYTFLIADITRFDFLMYNLQQKDNLIKGGDRLVAVLEGDKVQVFCTTVSAAQGLQLYQVFQKLVQEKKTSLEQSMKEVERFLNRRPSQSPSISQPPEILASVRKDELLSGTLGRLSLHTDVMVNLKEVHIGAFSQGFYDNQVFKLEALNATARFSVEMKDEKVRSMLQMTLGHLAVAVSPVKHQNPGKNAEVNLQEVIDAAISSKGGIILKVPQVQAKMETIHMPDSNTIDYIFKSAFEGQVDVGWNFSRVSYIKSMWQKHSKEFAQQQGKTPFSSRISLYTDVTPNSPTSSESPTGSGHGSEDSKSNDKKEKKAEKGKITAVVNVPQSKYEYNALEPPIIETPQLRDMGEATPPLEWIGLHRDRLPNLTHQIVIVPLLEVAKKVEDSYSKILGSS